MISIEQRPEVATAFLPAIQTHAQEHQAGLRLIQDNLEDVKATIEEETEIETSVLPGHHDTVLAVGGEIFVDYVGNVSTRMPENKVAPVSNGKGEAREWVILPQPEGTNVFLIIKNRARENNSGMVIDSLTTLRKLTQTEDAVLPRHLHSVLENEGHVLFDATGNVTTHYPNGNSAKK